LRPFKSDISFRAESSGAESRNFAVPRLGVGNGVLSWLWFRWPLGVVFAGEY
jgi:hypothetical protein